jgi:hypothetical protein
MADAGPVHGKEVAVAVKPRPLSNRESREPRCSLQLEVHYGIRREAESVHTVR